ncbi:methylmalonyl-CoA carboxyltransferase [Myxococcota bacterium]|nr:methylmalonyl-CoA carboxyltransferase [Myxococcota bacterium]
MSWQKEIDELRHRERLADQMGGDEKLERQRSRGKLNVRERVTALIDAGSLRETGKLAGKAEYDDDGRLQEFQASNFIFGRARIEGRPVVVTGDDFTIRGGAADASIHQKMVFAEQLANEMRLPLLRLIDGTGGGGSVKQLDSKKARTYIPMNPGWEFVVDNLAQVPVVALGLGPVAGLGAARLVNSHYSILVKQIGQMFVAGPPVVKRLGEDLTKEELGGADIHTRSGAVDDDAEDEQEAFAKARRFLSYLPSSVYELPPRGPREDDPQRRDEELLSIIPRNPRKVYKMRRILDTLCDRGSRMEIGRSFGRSVITSLARFDGWPVALIASDPYHYGGGWTADASQKLVRFIELAETFHLPVIHLVDCPGFVIGRRAEEQATIRHGSRALASVYQASVPWCSVIVRKAFGVAGAAHTNGSRYPYRFAWPSGDWGSLPVQGGIEAAYRAELEASEDPEKLLVEIQQRLDSVRSPFRTAEAFLAEEIIDPQDTRPLLCEFAELAAPLRTAGRSNFHLRP